ncbi:FAD dependent oxidoreductase, partial [Favolaschia claudopus]
AIISLFSRIRLIYQTLKSISDSFSAVSHRVSLDPGLPHPNPSRSYWCSPSSSLDSRPKDATLPEYADVVIIGSGISGTAIARTLLDSQQGSDDVKEPLRVVMLEARDVCSGATGRNGGHISPNTYQDYAELAAGYGSQAAQQIIRYRLAHLPQLMKVAKEEGLLEASQARVVEQFDAYLQEGTYQKARKLFGGYVDAIPEERNNYKMYEGEEAVKDLQLSSYITGCISRPGGAVHPYRLITGILSRLLAVYPSFHLFTQTPCTSIAQSPSGYIISTPKGTLKTLHIVHATNAWASHLLPEMRTKIIPVRVHMTAQRPGRSLGRDLTSDSDSFSIGSIRNWAGKRSFVFYPGASLSFFDYLTQFPLPSTPSSPSTLNDSNPVGAAKSPFPYPAPEGELLFGGGAALGGSGEAAMMQNVGVADDSAVDFEIGAYLGGAMERYFEGWGAEGESSLNDDRKQDKAEEVEEKEEWGRGRMKAAWTGIIGISADGQPWVGRVPGKVSGRGEPKISSSFSSESKATASHSAASNLAAPGEWIAAGFTGEGMTHAWLAGVEVARMVLGSSATCSERDETALPEQFLITEKRWKETDWEAFLGGALG